MATKRMFKDALDYIFIDSGNAPESFLLSNEVVASSANRVAVSTNGVIMGDITSSHGSTAINNNNNDFFVNTSLISAESSSSSVGGGGGGGGVGVGAAAGMENLYSSVAISLGTLLINDSFLSDVNTTSLFDSMANGSDLNLNGTDDEPTSEDIAELVKMAATSVVLGLMILITIIGNVFVIAAIILERNLQNVANYLVASLAVADLFVACLVMPLGAVYEISQGWILGPELCDIWTSCDVLCCTASILHLVAIATDRYWAVTNIDYMHSRTSRRIFLMIFFVWFAAVIVSLAPQFGWKDPDYLQRIEQQKCMVSQDVAYQVFATCCTFYVPLLVILVLYWKIYQTARKRIHRRRPRPIDVTANNNQPDLTQKKRKRLKLRIGKFSGGEKGKTGATLGLVEGNSTNTVNTVEDTEFSSSNVDSKSRAGIEVTTMFNNPEEAPTTSTSQISTVSHLVALANQQLHQQSTTSTATNRASEHHQIVHHNSHQLQQHLHDHHPQHHHHQLQHQPTTKTIAATVNGSTAAATSSTSAAVSTPAATTNPLQQTTTEKSTNAAPTTLALATTTTAPTAPLASATTTATTTSAVTAPSDESGDVLEDPQLQQQLQQVTAAAAAASVSDKSGNDDDDAVVVAAAAAGSSVGGGGGGGATTSTATTITSISALSPQTPLNPSYGGGISIAPAGTTQPQTQQQQQQLSHASANASNQVTPLPLSKQSHQHLSSIPNPQSKVTKRKETLEAKRERKAAKTLAIITGAFVVCWLPFFVMALLLPLCDDCEINDAIASFFLWLGYFNSTLNPVIYTIFSPEFRQAFKRILFGGHRPVHYRSGKI